MVRLTIRGLHCSYWSSILSPLASGPLARMNDIYNGALRGFLFFFLPTYLTIKFLSEKKKCGGDNVWHNQFWISHILTAQV